MKSLNKLTSGKCLIIWLFSFIAISVIDYIYLFSVAEEYTPKAFDALQKKPGYIVVVLIYLLFVSMPSLVIAAKLSNTEGKTLRYIISIILLFWSVLGIIGGIVTLVTLQN